MSSSSKFLNINLRLHNPVHQLSSTLRLPYFYITEIVYLYYLHNGFRCSYVCVRDTIPRVNKCLKILHRKENNATRPSKFKRQTSITYFDNKYKNLSSVSQTIDASMVIPTMGMEVKPQALQTWASDAGEW